MHVSALCGFHWIRVGGMNSDQQLSRGVELEFPRIRVLAQSRSWNLSFEGDSDSGPYLSHLDFSVICCSLLDFCAIYFTTKTLFVHYRAPFIRRIYCPVILNYTIIMSHNKSWSWSRNPVFFSAGVGVLHFLTLESESHKNARTPHPCWGCMWPPEPFFVNRFFC